MSHQPTDSQLKGIKIRADKWQNTPLLPFLKEMNIPDRFLEKIDLNAYSELYSYEFEESVFIYGETGIGKTTKAIYGIIKHLHDWNTIPEKFNPKKHAIFINANRMLEEIKNSYQKPGTQINESFFTASELIVGKYESADLLVIDDFGIEKTTDWAFQTLYMILNYRYEWNMTTIFTSNYSLNEIAAKFGDDRLTNRIAHWCKVIKLEGKNYRKQN